MSKPEISGMTLERITESKLDTAVRIQQELFPGESGKANFEESLLPRSDFAYYLICQDGDCAGVIGIYRYPEDPGSAWLGWFGILEHFRRKGLGSKALRMFEEMAEKQGYRFARLYTDADHNEAAIAFYQANGYRSEPYSNPQDPACLKYPTLIFSKSLTSDELVLWNSRNIHLTEQIAKQNKYGEKH